MRSLVANRRRGFTLVELLVVLTILAILMGVLFPVFAAAKRASQATVCLSNFKSASNAALQYTGDYDDRVMPANHRPGQVPDPSQDRVWPQILLPYMRGGFKIFDCPAEPNPMEFGGAFDPDLLPGDYAPRYYEAALHSDLGYNSYYLAPIVRQGDGWTAVTKSTTEVGDTSRTLLFIESRGEGGGSYLVAPPCRYAAGNDGITDTFLGQGLSQRSLTASDAIFTPIVGWDVSGTQSAFPTGGVGVRHGNKLNVSRLDGSAKAVTLKELEQGCDVRTAWQGTITDAHAYQWFPG